MRTTQEVFRVLIAAGLYGHDTRYMCNSLELAERSGIITAEERSACQQAIKRYMQALIPQDGDVHAYIMALACGSAWPEGPHLPLLSSCAQDAEWAEKVGTVLYWNWDNRPYPKREEV